LKGFTQQFVPWSCDVGNGVVFRGGQMPRTGKPVLHFAHGNGFSGLVYRELLARLSGHFDIFFTDMQGHGQSETGAKFGGWKQHSALLHQALESQRHYWDGSPLIGLGHSFGAVQTTFIAARDPGLFQELWLLDPVYLPRSWILSLGIVKRLGLTRRFPMAEQARKRRAHWPNHDEATDYFSGRGVFRDCPPSAVEAYIEHSLQETPKGLELCCPPWLEAEIFASFPEALWRAIKQVQVPALLHYGDNTYPFVSRSAQTVARINPRYRCTKVPGTHCFMLEHPADTAKRLLNHWQAGH